MTAEQFRKLVLTFDGAEEHIHHGHPDFRVGGKIFATLGYPDDKRAMVKLTPEAQAEFVHDYSQVFTPAAGAWGRQGSTSLDLPNARKAEVTLAVEAAWQNAIAVAAAGRKRKSAKR